MKVNELIKAIGALQNNENVQTFDLTSKEGYEGFKNVVKELRNSDTSLFDAFGIDIDEWLDNVETLGKKLHEAYDEWSDNVETLGKKLNESNKENKDHKEIVKDAVKQMERKVIDHSEEEEESEDEQKKEGCEFKRPSELLTIPQKLQLHKLVQEYVDTTIRPFNKGVLTNNQINDAYAGLYEFGAWILNR